MLRSEPGDSPAIALRGVDEAVVQAVLAVLPELVELGPHADAAPVLRQRQLAIGTQRLELRHEPLERGPALHMPALRRGERAHLASARAAADVLGGLLLAHALRRSLDSHLA